MMKNIQERIIDSFNSQGLMATLIESAPLVVSFCNLPVEEYGNSGNIQYWQEIPPVSVDDEIARNAILERLNMLIKEIR